MRDTVSWWPESRAEWSALAGVVAVAICARLFRLGADSFWLDEAASWWFASRPLAEQWQQIPFYEPHPPLYYGLLWAWSRIFGEGEAGMRGLSALASIATILVIYVIGRLTAEGREGKAIGLLAALLAALYPTQIYYAQEARVYALLTLAVSLLMAALLWFIAHPEPLSRPFRRFIADRTSGVRPAALTVLLATAFAFWFHNTALLLVGPLLLIAAVIVGAERGFSWSLVRNLAAIGAGILILWLPNVRWLISGMSAVQAGFWVERPRWWNVIYVGDQLVGSASVAGTYTAKVAITSCVLTICALGGLALWRRGRGAAALFLLACLLVPFVLAVVASYVITPIFMSRILVWIGVPAALLFAAGLLSLSPGFMRNSAVALVTLVLAVLVVSGWGRAVKEPWREVAEILAREADSHDLILADTAYAQVPLLYYRVPQRSRGKWLPVPAAYPLPMGANGYPDGFFMRVRLDAATLARVREAAGSSRKVWHVTRLQTTYDPDRQLPRALQALHGEGKVRVSNGTAVLLTEYPAR